MLMQHDYTTIKPTGNSRLYHGEPRTGSAKLRCKHCFWTASVGVPDVPEGINATHLPFYCMLQDSGKKADFIVHDDRSLLAVQGPAAHDALQPLLKDLDLNSFYFSNFAILDIAGFPCWLTGTG